METLLFMTILAMLVIVIISFIVLRKRWKFSLKLFLVGLIGFALPVMMIEGPINGFPSILGQFYSMLPLIFWQVFINKG